MSKQEIQTYTLENETHKVVISNLGAAIINFIIKRDDADIDVVLGHQDLESYEENPGNLGVVIGRNANRIEDASVTINDLKYDLEDNHFHNNLHTGSKGIQYKVFDTKQFPNHLEMTTSVKHLTDGFPGNFAIRVKFTLEEDTLLINYEALSDEDTIVNVTNHSYFNLNGQDGSNLYNQDLFVNAKFFMPNNEFSMPTKEILSVDNTAFDFTQERNLKDSLLSKEEQIDNFSGLDHNFLLTNDDTHLAASLINNDNHLQLNVYTSLPAMHIYAGNHFPDEQVIGKNNTVYPLHGGIAFETQLSPNSMMMPWLRSPLLKVNTKYDEWTAFQLKNLK